VTLTSIVKVKLFCRQKSCAPDIVVLEEAEAEAEAEEEELIVRCTLLILT
jgi:hypothetical protein